MNMIRDVLINITFNTFSVLDMILIMQLLLGVGFCRKKWHCGAFVASFLLMHAVMYLLWPENSMLHMVLVYAYITIVAMVLSPGRRFKTALRVIPALWIYIQWGVVISMVQDLLPITIPPMREVSTMTIIDLISDVVLFIMLAVVLRYFKKRDRLSPITLWETIFLTAFSFFSPVFSEILEMLMEVRKSPVRSIVWTIFVVAVNIVVFYGIIHRRNARYYKELSGNYKEQFDSEYNYFEQYKKEQQDVRKFRHDWNNHMLVLQSMLENKEYEKAREYFSGLSDQMKSSDHHFLTGNEIVDIILNSKSERIRENHIAVECNGGLEGLDFMASADCCILFSNIIDNAIEANMAYEGTRFIKIHAVTNPANIVISVENALSGSIVRGEDGLVTTKEEKGHGIGTQNAFAIIKKYKGEYEITTEKEVFSIRMLFPLP